MNEHVENVQERHGLFRNVPRFLRRAVERRLRLLEGEPDRLDRDLLVHHARLKRLHALLHIKPGERARAALFGKPAAGSARAALRTLARTKEDARAAADLVRRHRLPYLLVEAALGALPEPVAVALVETLDGGELLARLPLLARRGLIEGDVRLALLRRLTALASDPAARFPYQKIASVVRGAGLDRQVAGAAFALVASSPAEARLGGHTALLIDESSSMAREGGCLELAAAVAWRIDQALEEGARLYAYLFGTEARPVEPRRGRGLDQWRALLTGPVAAAPGTSPGAAVERLGQDRYTVSRLVFVTDGYENRPPRLAPAFARYRTGTGQRPAINLVQPADTALQLAVDLRNAQVPFHVFSVDRHLLGLDALIPALGAQTDEDRVAQILAFR
jgi:hypothetical protein